MLNSMKRWFSRSKKTRDSEATLRQLMEIIPVHVFWYDREGILQGCSEAQAKAFGYASAADMIGTSIYEQKTQSSFELSIVKRTNQQIFQTGEPQTAEEPFTYADGREAMFLSQKVALRNNTGKIIGILGVALDITDKKEREKLAAENEALNRANETMRFWAGAIAHEVRTPLFAMSAMGESVRTFMDMLNQEMPELQNASPRFLRLFEHIKKLPGQFAEVIKGLNHFVDMSLMKVQPERPKMYELKPLSIEQSVQSVMDAYPFKPHGEKSERDLVHISIEDDFSFDGESTLFKHMIYNLMKNALYFIKKSGKGEIFITARSEPESNILIFKDTGPGIPPENIEHLFKAFFTRSQGGTGVGLSLCRTIMHEFGGSIGCTSTFGEFTEFVMGFPKK